MARFPNTPPRERQRRLAEALIENATAAKPLNRTQLLSSVGYSAKTAKHLQKVILTSEGVKKALDQLGFNEQTAKSVVKEIMLNPEVDGNTRLKATDQVFKVEGSYKVDPTVPTTLNILNIFNDDRAAKIARRIIRTIPTNSQSSENKPD